MSFFSPHFMVLLHTYGSFGVFALLALGIIGLPVPEETLLLLIGYWIKSDQLPFISAWLAAVTGTLVGISVSYLIGRSLGYFAIHRLCLKCGLSPAHIVYAKNQFNRIGQWFLLIGYFIPGVRHLTGVLAGTTALSYRRFALFAYSGGFIWSHLFLLLGYCYGQKALYEIENIYHHWGLWIVIPIGMIIILWLWKK